MKNPGNITAAGGEQNYNLWKNYYRCKIKKLRGISQHPGAVVYENASQERERVFILYPPTCHNFYFLVGLYEGFSRYPDAYAARACRSACSLVG